MSCCCCTSPDGNNEHDKRTKGGRSDPPATQSMQRGKGDSDVAAASGEKNMDEDKKAVAWLRSRSLENLQKFQMGEEQGEPENYVAENRSQSTSQTFDKQRERMQNRNPLEKPYDISERERPLRPEDGNVLVVRPSSELATPSHTPVKKGTASARSDGSTPSTVASSPEVERFEPQASTPPRISLKRRQPSTQKHDTATDSAVAVLAPSSKKSTNQTTKVYSLSETSKKRDSKKKHSTAPNFVEVGGLMIPKSTQGVPVEEANSDHLSDVPSDVDSVSKERYLLACQILKSTLIEKEKSMVPIERDYILSLLGDFDKLDPETESSISESQVSAIETAALRLEQDPLFQTPVEQDKPPLEDSAHETLTAPLHARAKKNSVPEVRAPDFRLPDATVTTATPTPIAKHRHTATKPVRTPFGLCQPSSLEESGVAPEKDEERVMVLPADPNAYAESGRDEGLDQIKNEKEMVRFDGWSFHNAGDHYPFFILGADDANLTPRVLTPSLMEALRGFFPFTVSESNFWLKFSLVRDGASLASLLASVRASTYTVVCVETAHGEVFGSFTGSPWRTGTKWYGSGESFLWRLKKSRYTAAKNSDRPNFENEMEVYPFTGYDDLVQYCTTKTMAVGGGDWMDLPCPFDNEPKGIGFMVDGDLQGGETNSCATFANPRLSKRASTSNEFSIGNLEVWTLTPCITVKEAEKLELKRLFVEENIQ